MSQKVNLNAYFERIGFAGSIAPTLATLETIHGLHPVAIPFENLDPLMGRPVQLDQASLEQKMLHKGRGGYCFEHNTLLMNELRELDYSVRGHAARMLWGHGEGGASMISHMVLVVDISGSSYLCDVGCSVFTLTAPLKLRDGVEQQVGDNLFRLSKVDDLWRLDVKLGEDWRGIYQFEPVEQSEGDIAAINSLVEKEYYSRALLFAARVDKEVQYALSGNRLSIYRAGQDPERRYAEDVAGLRTMLADVFRITLPTGEDFEPALQRVLTAAPARATVD
ncbi:arylamine N-acetyltransferase family protein [Devosia aquimaris]|uniref:arylamine N-acetyltransferase family protein n=1 Tax=Devosia aquimaris TaxID=2866214 RepID=UPI001CD09AB6|nr:arylamine N-acetyltransferase [Devosia sp. CJK-A8-3]